MTQPEGQCLGTLVAERRMVRRHSESMVCTVYGINDQDEKQERSHWPKPIEQFIVFLVQWP